MAKLDIALKASAPGPFQIEAAISATHCRAATARETDWREIAELYALHERARPSAGVRVNRAFAVGQAFGAIEGLAVLDGVDDSPYADLVRGALLEDMQRPSEALACLELAASNARNGHEATQIRARIARLREKERS